MITYPEQDYVQRLKDEMLERTRGLLPYQDGPGVDYGSAPHAYALNISLLHDPVERPENGLYVPSPEAEVLLGKRGSGHGRIGSWSGISGYIDMPNEDDPIYFTACEELRQECGLSQDAIEKIDLRVGQLTVENRTQVPGAKITVVPILGICATKPVIEVDGVELTDSMWVRLGDVKNVKDADGESLLARGYLDITLPGALGAIGLSKAQINAILYA